jgi:hypothetical protein
MTAAAEAAAALGELAAGTDDRTDTARLRDVYPAVEAALAAGVSHTAVHQKLVEKGFAMSFGSYNSALHRLRKKAKASAKASALAPSVGQQAPARDRAITPEDLRKSREVDVDMKSLTKRGS